MKDVENLWLRYQGEFLPRFSFISFDLPNLLSVFIKGRYDHGQWGNVGFIWFCNTGGFKAKIVNFMDKMPSHAFSQHLANNLYSGHVKW